MLDAVVVELFVVVVPRAIPPCTSRYVNYQIRFLFVMAIAHSFSSFLPTPCKAW